MGGEEVRLDHVGVVGPEIGALHAAYEALGFTLTPLARQSGRLQHDGPVVPWGTANRCAMLRDGYIELLGVVDPAAPLNGLDRFLARGAGVHILAFAIDDEAAALARLRRAGVDIAGVLHLERPVDSAEPDGLQARFARLPLPNAPEGRVQLIRHLTPEAIWQERWMGHRNRAVGLEAVIVAAAAPAESAARFSRLTGRPVLPDPAGGFVLELARGRVRVLDVEALGAVLPGVVAPALPWTAGVVVRTEDGAAAARELAALEPVPGGWMAGPAAAGGVAVAFC